MKKILVLGGGGFIGGHLAKKNISVGNYVRIADIKEHEYFERDEICNHFFVGDLRDPLFVREVFSDIHWDEVYQLAADMGGAGYIFTGENDANVMSNSALINLNVVQQSVGKVNKLFYSSSACIYPEHNQLDPENPNCEESSAYPADPDSEYGWEKLFSERLYLAYHRNYNLDVRIARFHNIFGPQGTWRGGKEKAPAAVCRKVSECEEVGEVEIWGDGLQTRSFLYIDECLLAIEKFMLSDYVGPINIGSEEMVTINELVKIVEKISLKKITIKNIDGHEFFKKYGFKCPQGVRGRKSDNSMFYDKIGWKVSEPLEHGLIQTYEWINKQFLDTKNR